MKWMTYTFGLIVAFTLQVAIAGEPPVTISDPTPAIAKSYDVGTPKTVTYTITNNVPHVSFPITVSGLSGIVSRTEASDHDCGDSLLAGPSTCHLAVLIDPRESNMGDSVNQTLSVNYHGRGSLNKNIAFSVPETVLTAVGQGINLEPILYVSRGNDLWTVPTGLSNILPSEGFFNDASCVGRGNNAVCIATGEAGRKMEVGAPLLIVSTDGGQVWTRPTIDNLPSRGHLETANCVSNGSVITCVAVGQAYGYGDPALLVVGNYDMQQRTWSWTKVDTSNYGNAAKFKNIHCIGGAPAMCVAVGEARNNDDDKIGLLVMSDDGGQNWIRPDIADLPILADFESVSCTYRDRSNIVCAAVGAYYDVDINNNVPLLVVGNYDGQEWAWERKTSRDVPALPAIGAFTEVNCASTGVHTACNAIGKDYSDSGRALLLTSSDSGQSWINRTPEGTPDNSIFYGISCSSDVDVIKCPIVGEDESESPSVPLLAFITYSFFPHHEEVHTRMTVTEPSPIVGYFNDVACTGITSEATCAIVGEQSIGYQSFPLILETTDGFSSWDEKTLIDPPQGGFDSVTATGGKSGVVARHSK